LLRFALPPDRRDDVLGDFDEIFLRRCEERGHTRARFAYWRDALTFSTRFLCERMKDGLPRIASVSVLEVRLAGRKLVRSWGLTLVGGLAMTTAMAMGAVLFSVVDTVRTTSVPLDEGDRIVALQAWDPRAAARVPTPVEDFRRWREQVRSVEDIGAFQTIQRNLVVEGALPEPAHIAEMTASGFALARVAPLMGRPIVAQDELPGAAPVLVIGYDAWRGRFASAPGIIGRDVRLGRAVHTVVGVMPEGFAFPVNHQFWVALRPDEHEALLTTDGRGAVFARLAEGETIDRAAAELAAIGLENVSAEREASVAARTRVVPYAFAFTDELGDSFVTSIVTFLGALLLLPPCANLSILIYARTAARREEFAARHALGASRNRIVGQLFLETLALAVASGIAALIVVGAIRYAFFQFMSAQAEGLPFWADARPSVDTMLFVAALVIAAAVIAGVLPALQATGRLMKVGLGSMNSRTGPSLGRTWTVLVVAQVGFSVAAIPLATEMAWGTLRPAVVGPGFPTEEFVTARLHLDAEAPDARVNGEASEAALSAHMGRVQDELLERLRAEPGLIGATLGSAVPGAGTWRTVQIEPGASGEAALASPLNDIAQVTQIAPDFFETFGIEFRSGRAFDARDAQEDERPAIVSEAFSGAMFPGQNPLGRRFRYASSATNEGDVSARSYEIVGVVEDLPANEAYPRTYHPVSSGELNPATLVVRFGSGDRNVGRRIREVAAAVDPELRLEELTGLDAIYRERAFGNTLGALTLASAMLSVLLLSAAGMYALMSFTVNQRRREIGIRAALGAQPGRLLYGVFRKAAWQLGAGALLGGCVATAIEIYVPDDVLRAVGGRSVPGVLPAIAAIMIAVGLLAALGPARRGLRVSPTEAMRGVE
jgi:predicted permease